MKNYSIISFLKYNASKAVKAGTGNAIQKRVFKILTKSLKNTWESVNFL